MKKREAGDIERLREVRSTSTEELGFTLRYNVSHLRRQQRNLFYLN